MKPNLLIIFVMFATLLSGASALAEELYTWEDAQGNLNVTSERPSDGVEILAIDQVKMKSSEEMRKEVLARELLRAKERARRRAAAARKPVVEEKATLTPPTEDEKQDIAKDKAKRRAKKKRTRTYRKIEERQKVPVR